MAGYMPQRVFEPAAALIAQHHLAGGTRVDTPDDVVCLTPESGRKWMAEFMSAYDPKRTFVPDD